jgi:hypothetical protein
MLKKGPKPRHEYHHMPGRKNIFAIGLAFLVICINRTGQWNNQITNCFSEDTDVFGQDPTGQPKTPRDEMAN